MFQLVALLLYVCFITSSGFTSIVTLHGQNPSWKLFSSPPLSSTLPEKLIQDIEMYMKARKQLEQDDNVEKKVLIPVSQWRKKKEAPTEPFGIAKGAGFFKDPKYEVDLRQRSDTSMPLVQHPLSFVELDRFGYGRLADGIIAYGGPYVVGSLVNLDWIEPEIELEPEPESSRPVREETFSLDMRGELVLGGGLEERLAQAEAIDMAKLKKSLLERKEYSQRSDYRIENEAGPNYVSGKVKVSERRIESEEIVEGERFSLDNSERLFLVVNLAAYAISHGRASADLIEHNYFGSSGLAETLVDISATLSIVAVSAAVLSSAASAFLAIKSTNQKSASMWAAKGLLGGPSTVAKIKQA